MDGNGNLLLLGNTFGSIGGYSNKGRGRTYQPSILRMISHQCKQWGSEGNDGTVDTASDDTAYISGNTDGAFENQEFSGGGRDPYLVKINLGKNLPLMPPTIRGNSLTPSPMEVHGTPHESAQRN